MLVQDKLNQLNTLIESFTPEELIWINGYINGLVKNVGSIEKNTQPAAQKSSAMAVEKLNIVYATETGNAKQIALDFATKAKQNGIPNRCLSIEQYKPADLEKDKNLYLIISTQGEGEVPESAKNFLAYISTAQVNLSNLNFSILALGDTAYPLFCKAGEDVADYLKQLKANLIFPIEKCDVDYENQAKEWIAKIIQQSLRREPLIAQANIAAPPPEKQDKKPAKTLYTANITAHINLNDYNSQYTTFHIELETQEPVVYEAGDAIGLVPKNPEKTIAEIFELTQADKNTIVQTPKAEGSLYQLFKENLNVFYLMKATVQKYATIVQQTIPDVRMDLLDLLKIYPLQNPEQLAAVAKILLPIAPRLYTIASSPATHGENNIHITVEKNTFFNADQQHKTGLASQYLENKTIGDTTQFYVHKNKNFKLPAPDKNIILIATKTGVAACRSFLWERDAQAASGKNWFFYGNQHFHSDFLYQTEWQQLIATGVIEKIDLAWSRDQAQKIYVQQLLKQQAPQLMQWINDGASVYLAGDKEKMSVAVEQTLKEIIADYNKISIAEAQVFLQKLQKEGRYEKDVY